MEFDNNIPIYIQVIDIIKKQIVSQNLQGGDKLPSVRELAVKLKVNPNTIQRAYQELEREGITETKRGQGSYLTKDRIHIQKLKDEMCHKLIQNFIKEMRGLGFSDSAIIKMMSNDLEEFKCEHRLLVHKLG